MKEENNMDNKNNAVSMREALEEVSGTLESILTCFAQGEGGVYLSDIRDVLDKARAALSATPRNCDRFQDAKEALRELRKRITVDEPVIMAAQMLFATEVKK